MDVLNIITNESTTTTIVQQYKGYFLKVVWWNFFFDLAFFLYGALMKDKFKINRYITETEEAQDAFFKWIDNLPNECWALIDSPTESGKSTAILKYFKHQPQRKKVLLAPTQSLVNNLALGKDVKSGYGYEFINGVKNEKAILTTYDSLMRMDNVDDVFVDEAHLIAGHSSFREVLQGIIEAKKCRVILMSGTPEIIQDIQNIHYLKIDLKEPVKRFITVCGSNGFRSKGSALGVAEMAVKRLDECLEWGVRIDSVPTVMIRLNNKETLDEVFEMFKDKLRVAKFYSDKPGVINTGQDDQTVEDLKQGKIKDIDLLLVTSIYDAGLSFVVERSIDCYAISHHKDFMPNVVDMMQLSARVRANDNGINMTLTVLGCFGDMTNIDKTISVTEGGSKDVLYEMKNRYEKYQYLNEEYYVGLLEHYGFIVDSGGKQPFNGNEKKYANQQRKLTIAKNLNNFKIPYDEIIDRAKEMDRRVEIKEAITGDEVFRGGMTSSIKRIFNAVIDCLEHNIHIDLLMGGKKFQDDRINNLVDLANNYDGSEDETFTKIITELIEGIDMKDSRVNLDGMNTLVTPYQDQIKTLGNLLYVKPKWTRKSFKLNAKKDLIKERLYVDTLTGSVLNKLESIIATTITYCMEHPFELRRITIEDYKFDANSPMCATCDLDDVMLEDLSGIKAYEWRSKKR